MSAQQKFNALLRAACAMPFLLRLQQELRETELHEDAASILCSLRDLTDRVEAYAEEGGSES